MARRYEDLDQFDRPSLQPLSLAAEAALVEGMLRRSSSNDLRSCDAYAGHPSLVCIAPKQINHDGPRIRTSRVHPLGVHSRNRSSIMAEPSHPRLPAPETTALSSITSSRDSTQVTALAAAIKLTGIQGNRHFLQRGPVLIFCWIWLRRVRQGHF